ncbi:MAG: hypothetical protein GEEBNDBF_00133 [bacterium]|nr:hypothetical protein [bacterium]
MPFPSRMRPFAILLTAGWRLFCVWCLLVLVAAPALTAPAEETTKPRDARVLEFFPLYKYKNAPQDAVNSLYATLADLGITERDVTITVLGMAPDKLAVQGREDQVQIVKQLLQNIDPAPKPQPPKEKAAEYFEEVKVQYLNPEELWTALDQVMFTFLDFKRFDPGMANLVVYAQGDGSESRLTFYIPNPGQVMEQFERRGQGYSGYLVHLRATDKEKDLIATLKSILKNLDQPAGQKRHEVLEVNYLEIGACIDALKASGFNAVNISGQIDAALLGQIQSGASPIIYSAPSIAQSTADVSTSFSGSGSGVQRSQFKVLTFDKPVAASDLHRLIVYGTDEEIAGVRAFVDLIDVPARQMMIEAQIVEINVDSLTDLGLRAISGVDDLVSGGSVTKFPGEGSATTGGIDASSFFTYDDAAQPAGSFQAQLAALILQGKASIRARPRVMTVDGRQAIISIVRQVPVAQETLNPNNDRSTFDISYIPAGITLNIKPRVGENNSEVQLQVNAVVSNVETINNVVSGLNLTAPTLNTREVSTFARVPNHKSLVLGGLIDTETEERTFKTPILGDLPLIGGLFRRTRRKEDKTEVMIIITPHIMEEAGGRTQPGVSDYTIDDPRSLPKGSEVFHSLDSLLFQGSYILRIPDIKGIDPVSRTPLSFDSEDPPLGAIDDPVFLTIAGIVRELNLAKTLGLTEIIQFPRDWPGPRTSFEARRLAESFLIGYIIESNHLRIPDLQPGREILIPTSSRQDDPNTGFSSETWRDLNLLSVSRGGLYDTILQSLRGLDYSEQLKENARP